MLNVGMSDLRGIAARYRLESCKVDVLCGVVVVKVNMTFEEANKWN